LLLPKLKSYKTYIKGKDIEYIKTIADIRKKTLKSIEFGAIFRENETNIFFQQISLLKSLEKMNFDVFNFDSFNGLLHFDINSLKLFSKECNELKELNLRINIPFESRASEMFRCMSSFKQLNHLCLCLNIGSPETVFEENIEKDEIKCETLKGCEQLTYLVIENPEINHNFFENIYKHLPKLKHLDIRVSDITDKALYSLSKLTKLETLCIRCYGYHLPYVTDSGLIKVIQNCPQIKSILFNSKPEITHKTIKALIALALRKPRIQFKHQFSKNGLEDDFMFSERRTNYSNTIDLETYELPHNLIIIL
jgi:hypothetical protein